MGDIELENKIIIFGAGTIGHMVLKEYGIEKVAYFIDNNDSLYEQNIENIPIKKVEDAIQDSKQFKIIIASKSYMLMEKQLLDLGIENYDVFKDLLTSYFATDEIIFNPYKENIQRKLSEEEWIENLKKNNVIDAVNHQVEQLYKKNILFNHVEIETVNRCNGNCNFCPVSQKNDTRKLRFMKRNLFESIILQLSEINYSGRLALFSNNEPFLDKDIIDKHRYARKKLPYARMHLFTNGTLLTLEKFVEIINYLDELIIDNYHKDLKLINPCKVIKEYCENHIELKKKVTIVLRDPNEILSTRGGDAPNRKKKISYGKERCVLPFKQLIIRPDGKISLCCNDPLGKYTLGNVTEESILSIWNNDKFKMVRECLYKGRENLEHCKYCDAFNLG